MPIFLISVLFTSGQVTHYGKFSGTKLFSKTNFYFNAAKKSYIEKALYFSRPLAIIPANYYTQHLGIMCKKELTIEKITKIPFRMRLGSLQQCNYLEGKK